MMVELWSQRLWQHLKKMTRYAKYVSNDQFVLVVVMLLGIGAVYYNQWVEKLDTADTFFVRIGMVVVLSSAQFMGQLATLVVEADSHFLSPLEQDWDKYMTKASQYSLVFPALFNSVLMVVLYPLFLVLHQPNLWGIYLIGLFLKWQHIQWLKRELTVKQTRRVMYKSILLMLYLGIYTLAIFYSVLLAVSIAFLLGCSVTIYVSTLKQRYQWDAIVSQEVIRKNRIYQFLQWFVDVPMSHTTIKRWTCVERYLQRTDNLSIYLFERLFLRSPNYLGNTVRLSLFVCILSIVVANVWVFNVLILLVQYVTVIQLLALYQQARQYMVLMNFPSLYDERKAYSQFVQRILRIQMCIIFVCGVCVFRDWQLFLSVGTSLVGIYVILPLYLTKKIDRMEDA